jgi:hypothetical protein
MNNHANWFHAFQRDYATATDALRGSVPLRASPYAAHGDGMLFSQEIFPSQFLPEPGGVLPQGSLSRHSGWDILGFLRTPEK